MIPKSIVLFTLLFFGLTYEIAIKCGTTNCPADCKECQGIDGGPFSKKSICMDSIGGCGEIIPFNLTFGCGGCGTDCSYTVSI